MSFKFSLVSCNSDSTDKNTETRARIQRRVAEDGTPCKIFSPSRVENRRSWYFLGRPPRPLWLLVRTEIESKPIQEKLMSENGFSIIADSTSYWMAAFTPKR